MKKEITNTKEVLNFKDLSKIEARCNKCKCMHTMNNTKAVKSFAGRCMIVGECVECGTSLHRVANEELVTKYHKNLEVLPPSNWYLNKTKKAEQIETTPVKPAKTNKPAKVEEVKRNVVVKVPNFNRLVNKKHSSKTNVSYPQY